MKAAACRVLLLLAAALLGAGFFLPAMTVIPGFGELHPWIVLFQPDATQSKTYSLFSGIQTLWHGNSRGLAVLLFSFSIVFPVLKLAAMSWSLAAVQHGRLMRWLHHAGKFSMLDVLVIALIVLAVKGLPGSSRVELGNGVWAFSASVILSVIAAILLSSIEKQREASVGRDLSRQSNVRGADPGGMNPALRDDPTI